MVAKSSFWIIRKAMLIAPIAAFGAIAFTVAQFGLATLLPLAALVGEFFLTCVLFFALVLAPIAWAAGFNLLRLMRYIREELVLVLGTSSSESVFPQLTQKLTRLGVDESVVGLVLPPATASITTAPVFTSRRSAYFSRRRPVPRSVGSNNWRCWPYCSSPSKGGARRLGFGDCRVDDDTGCHENHSCGEHRAHPGYPSDPVGGLCVHQHCRQLRGDPGDWQLGKGGRPVPTRNGAGLRLPG